MPDSEPQPPYEGAKDMLPVTILEDGEKLRAMVAEMCEELPERKPGKGAGKGKKGVKKRESVGASESGGGKTGAVRKGGRGGSE